MPKVKTPATLAGRSKLNANRIEAVKQHIKLSELVNKVQDCALGETEMSITQLNAAKMLIERLLPVTKHEITETTVNNVYTVSDNVSNSIARMIQQAQERVINGQDVTKNVTIDQKMHSNEGEDEEGEGIATYANQLNTLHFTKSINV